VGWYFCGHGRNLAIVGRLGDGMGMEVPFCEGVKRIISLRVLNSQCEDKRVGSSRQSRISPPLSSSLVLGLAVW